MSNFSLNIDRLIFNQYLNPNIQTLIKCKICLGVLTDPYDCTCCNSTFCFTCINNVIIKSGKCPFDQTIFVQEGEMSALDKLKPSSSSINNFLSSLKFSCINKNQGCMEELNNNSVFSHEINCPFIEEVVPQRRMSVMSFNPRIEPLENLVNLNTNNEIKQCDKIDRIYDMLQFLQISLNGRNSLTTPTKEHNSETPKFSLSINSNNIYNKNHTSESIKDSQNLSHTLQFEKLISELDYLNDKVSSLESTIDNNNHQQESIIKKMFEEQFMNLFERLRDSTGVQSTVFSSSHNSIANSLRVLPKSKSSQKLDLKSNVISKKHKIETTKNVITSVHNNTLQTPTKNNSSNYQNVSPRITKNLSKMKEFNSKFKVNNSYCNTSSNYETIKEESKYKKKINLDHSFDDLIQNDKYLEKLDLMQYNITNLLDGYNNTIKQFSSLNEKLAEDIKTNFIEVTLDSTNVFVQKFDEFINKLKFTPFKLDI